MSARDEQIEMWRRAAGLAARMHAGQKRKDGKTPYVAHPFRVAMIVRDVFGCVDPVCLAAALLHDVIEDTPADFEDIVECAGEEVARIVAVLTKDMRLPEEDREPAYDAGVHAADWRAKLIKLADCYDNLLDIGEREDRRDPSKGLDKARRAIACAGAERGPGGEVALAADLLRGLVSRMETTTRA